MKLIDLFSGCGGLSTGYEMAGYEVVLALEKDEWASETYRFNHPNTKVITGDITQILNPLELLDENVEIDGIIGGPPCQGFSLSGKRDKNDPRNSLFMNFISFVKAYSPKFFMMENVPGILSMETQKGEKVVDLIFDEYEKAGYNATYFKLNAADYGVPQSRYRVIFIGIRKDLPFNMDDLKPSITHPEGSQISIADAIMDLPQIEAGQGKEVGDYAANAETEYAKWARGTCNKLYNHVSMRHTQRIIERFKVIPQGGSLADVPEEHMQRQRGNASQISGKTYSQNNMRPYPDRPSPTIAASFQGNFVHPYLNRNYTAREAARLQSFPDWYVFKGKRTTMSWEKCLSQYQQIGNAVPPLLARAIAMKIKDYIEKISK